MKILADEMEEQLVKKIAKKLRHKLKNKGWKIKLDPSNKGILLTIKKDKEHLLVYEIFLIDGNFVVLVREPEEKLLDKIQNDFEQSALPKQLFQPINNHYKYEKKNYFNVMEYPYEDGPLDMRVNKRGGFSDNVILFSVAKTILNTNNYKEPINDLVKVHEYIKQQFKDLEVPKEQGEFRLEKWDDRLTWVYAVPIDWKAHRPEIDLRKQFTPDLSTRIYKAENHFWIYFRIMRSKPFLSKLYKRIKDYSKLDEQVGEYFFETPHFTLDGFMNILNNYTPPTPPTKQEKFTQQLAETLNTWLSGEEEAGDNQKVASKLEKLCTHLPPEVRKYSGKLLYRGIMVNTTALNKCLKENKPLTYHSRKYSSWTIWEEVAEEFATDEFKHEGYKGVIFAKKFLTSQIVVNVNNLAKYLGDDVIGKYPQIFRYTRQKDQGELIVKLTQTDLKFTKKDIYAYEIRDGWKYRG